MRRVVVSVAVLAAMVLVGVVLARSDGGSTAASPVGSAAVGAPIPSAAFGGERVGPGAVEAAVAAVALTGEVVSAGLISRRELIESFTTPGFGGKLADLTSEQVTAMGLAMAESGRDGAALSVGEFPLRARVVDKTADAVTVQVWSVLVVSSPDEPVGRQAWRTVTLEMVPVDGRWLVDGWESAEGPAPAGTPHGAVASGADVVSVLGWEEVAG
ncbi:MAG TPA: hypothetical protein VNQ73_08765 [Ilumatobacter sp.]|nr:hypothetical protein [Ilumatobacter sp.]